MKTLKLLKYQLRDVFRSRWLIGYFLFFLLITDGLFRFNGDPDKVLLGLMNIVLLVIPLVSALLGSIYVYNSREYFELLLSHPVKRSSLFSGFYMGLTFPFMVAFALGVTIPFLFHGFPPSVGPLFTLLVTGMMLTAVFLALSFRLALSTDDKARGLGYALVLWLSFAVLYDGVMLFLIHHFADYPLQYPVLVMTMLNPVDLARIVLMMQFDISALMGFTGAVFQRFFGSWLGILLSGSVLSLWMALPFLSGYRLFQRKDF